MPKKKEKRKKRKYVAPFVFEGDDSLWFLESLVLFSSQPGALSNHPVSRFIVALWEKLSTIEIKNKPKANERIKNLVSKEAELTPLLFQRDLPDSKTFSEVIDRFEIKQEKADKSGRFRDEKPSNLATINIKNNGKIDAFVNRTLRDIILMKSLFTLINHDIRVKDAVAMILEALDAYLPSGDHSATKRQVINPTVAAMCAELTKSFSEDEVEKLLIKEAGIESIFNDRYFIYYWHHHNMVNITAYEYLKSYSGTLGCILNPIVRKLLPNKEKRWSTLKAKGHLTSMFKWLIWSMMIGAKPVYREFYRNGFNVAEFLRFLTEGQEILIAWKAAKPQPSAA